MPRLLRNLTLLVTAIAFSAIHAGCLVIHHYEKPKSGERTTSKAKPVKVDFSLPAGTTLLRGNLPTAIAVDGDTGASAGDSCEAKGFLEEVSKYDVVFFGELHGHQQTHRFELDLLTSMKAKRGGKVSLALEMFERDQQRPLSEYLSGMIDESQFKDELKQSHWPDKQRIWGNYDRDYRPLIEFSKEHKLPVLAAFCPRPLASRIFREGPENTLESVDHEERTWLPTRVNADEGPYRERFLGVMGVSGHGDLDEASAKRWDQMYASQCVKDDAMAESIALHTDQFPERVVLAYCGGFHSWGGLGAVERLKWRRPDLKIAVINAVFLQSEDDEPDLDAGHWVLVVDPPKRR